MPKKNEIDINSAVRHIKTADPVLYKIIQTLPQPKVKARKKYFQSLVSSIISQQLSTKAAETIEKRFRKLFKETNFPLPATVLNISEAKMRSVGLSQGKIRYIKEIAKAFIEKRITPRKFASMTDQEIIEELVKIKGIGRWTAEMFLMFSLGRPDVFSNGDLGLKKAVQRVYNFKTMPTEKQFAKLAAKWSPHRTTASRYLWLSLDQK